MEGEEASVKLDAMGSFLYYIRETALNKALLEIEKTLPEKIHLYVSSKGTARNVTGKTKLAVDGRRAVVMLKSILPTSTLPQLKKMYAKAGLEEPPEDKDLLIKKIVGAILPTYPFDNPWGPMELPETVAVEVEPDLPLPQGM